ncbi:MAG: phosphatase PAP2 family protein [Prevotella sp.]|nr:phosphatase PAP2 family protein [Prevotella sp.]
MKHLLTTIFLTMTITVQANTDSYKNMEPLKLTVPEMKAELGTVINENDYRSELALTAPEPKMDFAFFKSRTNPDTKAYKFMDDMTFVGVPLFVAGIIAKSEKNAFKQQTKHSLLTKFKTGIDDYTQFFGPVAVVGMKLGGYEGRSDWPRLLASAGMGYGIMALLVNTIKHTAKEMRPDGSTANSWPSGHTATAFVGATLLHKEYGLTRSPWWSVAGYSVATATGVMRVLNNRHWISDVLSGAGIGILSGELGYALCDLLFKGKGLLRNDIIGAPNVIDHPSFFSISMGIGLGTRDLDFNMKEYGWADNLNLKFQASTAVSAEGAYFFNPYIGVGGRLRVKSSPIKGWNKITDFAWEDVYSLYDEISQLDEEDLTNIEASIDDIDFVIESDHLTEFAVDLGAYFNFPLSNRFALGSKLLFGRSIMQELSLNAKISGKEYQNGDKPDQPTGKDYDLEWDYFTVDGNKTWKFGTGLSLTYAYKKNFSWKVFLDYDVTRKTYTMNYNYGGYLYAMIPSAFENMTEQEYKDYFTATKSIKKTMHSFVLGASFAVNF